MVKFLVKTFVKDYENTGDRVVREKYTTLSGVLGIICNAVLFGLKLTIGLLTASIAIISDAFNNLSDMGTSAVSIISAKMSNKQADHEHPYGHGRIEYIASLIVSFLIMLVGFELLGDSLDGILHPSEVSLSPVLLIILFASIIIKVWMFFYNRYLSKAINSSLLEATAKDSLSDCISTGAVVIASCITLVSKMDRFSGTFFSKIPFDGIIGLVVSALILWNGFTLGKEVVDLLLGGAPDPELIQELKNRVLAGKDILGVHDLMVHDYGPGRIIASAHAEVPHNGNIIDIHETIDEIEYKAKTELGIIFVIHMDPIVIDSPKVNELRELTTKICHELDERYTIHDFRITVGDEWYNLIFDMVVTHDVLPEKRKEAAEYIKRRLSEEDSKLHAVVQVETGLD